VQREHAVASGDDRGALILQALDGRDHGLRVGMVEHVHKFLHAQVVFLCDGLE